MEDFLKELSTAIETMSNQNGLRDVQQQAQVLKVLIRTGFVARTIRNIQGEIGERENNNWWK